MQLGVEGRRALICGGSRRIGKAGALALACEGVDIVIVARTAQPRAQAATQIRGASKVRVAPVLGDLTTAAAREAALAACPAPDVLINNADGPPPGDFRDWARDDWIRALDSMMLAPIEMMRLCVDGMMERGFGRNINRGRRLCGVLCSAHAGFVAGQNLLVHGGQYPETSYRPSRTRKSVSRWGGMRGTEPRTIPGAGQACCPGAPRSGIVKDAGIKPG